MTISVKQQPPKLVPAEKYLKSINTRPHHITSMVDWAKRKGFLTATNSEWKELFKSY